MDHGEVAKSGNSQPPGGHVARRAGTADELPAQDGYRFASIGMPLCQQCDLLLC